MTRIAFAAAVLCALAAPSFADVPPLDNDMNLALAGAPDRIEHRGITPPASMWVPGAIPISAPAVVAAPIAPAGPSWQAQLLMLVIGFLGLLLTGMAGLLMRYAAKKLHLDVLAKEADHVDGIAQQGIHYAEEQAYKAIQAKLPPTPGSEKLDMAAKFVAGQIADAKLPEKGADAIKAIVEAKLGETRAADPAVVS